MKSHPVSEWTLGLFAFSTLVSSAQATEGDSAPAPAIRERIVADLQHRAYGVEPGAVPLLGGERSIHRAHNLAQKLRADFTPRALHLRPAGAGGELLRQPTLSGPVATYHIGVPNDPSLLGAAAYTQALHFGGGAPFALSNAQDLALGR